MATKTFEIDGRSFQTKATSYKYGHKLHPAYASDGMACSLCWDTFSRAGVLGMKGWCPKNAPVNTTHESRVNTKLVEIDELEDAEA